MPGSVRSATLLYGPTKLTEFLECRYVSFSRKGKFTMKRIKGNVIYTALWLTGIVSFVLASGAPNKWNP